MGEQRTFAGIAWSQKGKVTRREQFLTEMDAVIPWTRLLALIEPYYPKAGRGRQPLGLEKMLRIYFLQQWFNLADPPAEDAIYDSEAMRRFARVELGDDVVPDETTILRFRHLLEPHRLTAAIFYAVKELLTAKRLLLKSGTIVDATIIAAPSSTKNAAQARDPEMKQTRKGNAWHFGMKLHVGTDLRGRVHSLTATHELDGHPCGGRRHQCAAASGVGDERREQAWPLATGLQEQVANHRKRLGSKAPVVSVAEKVSQAIR
jgi:IS5 family transposase